MIEKIFTKKSLGINRKLELPQLVASTTHASIDANTDEL